MLWNVLHISSDSFSVGENPSAQALTAVPLLVQGPRMLGDEPFLRFILMSVILTINPLGQLSGSLVVSGKVMFVPEVFAAS